MKGILLAGGSGTRLYPSTRVVCKQLLPVYDKPLIYYPLSTLMLAGIREVLVISTPEDEPRIRTLLGDGAHLGMKLSYAVQSEPRGIAEAFILGREFVGRSRVCLILGDNIFYGSEFPLLLRQAQDTESRATILGYRVRDPERFGVVEFNQDLEVLSLEEKPKVPKSHWAVVGLYFYPNSVLEIAGNLTPSSRGELEITDINREFLRRGELRALPLGRGYAWLDAGTPSAMLEAGNFVRVLEDRQGFKISCIEEIAYRMGWISRKQLVDLGEAVAKSEYGAYLLHLAKEDVGVWRI